MPFNLEAFSEAKLVPRTADVRVDGLQQFFGKKGKPLWTVRGATGEETFRAAEAQSKQINMAAMVKALVTSEIDESKKVESIRNALGITGQSVPGELAKRIELLTMCSVKPKIDGSIAVKLAEAFPVDFTVLTNKIVELTGKGQTAEEKP